MIDIIVGHFRYFLRPDTRSNSGLSPNESGVISVG